MPMNNLGMLRTHMDNRERQTRGHEPIWTGLDARTWNYGSDAPVPVVRPGDRPGRRRRADGPVFLVDDGRRLDRHGAAPIVRKVARRAGITKTVTPHTLRHAFITAALDAGVPLRDVQEAASDADPRTTMRYDRARGSLDRHATYIVAVYIAGAAR
jgi:integrase/recombinase XerD